MTSANLIENSLAASFTIHRFTIEQYHQMGELGVLTPEDRVELLEGLIVEKKNQRPIHGYIVGLMNEWFQQKLGPGWIVRCQLPISTERSEPEPDLAILKGSHSDYRHKHPIGSDCRLVVEVADTSLEKDRAKTMIYRNSGVQEYWIVNVQDRALERHVFLVAQSTDAPSHESRSVYASGTVDIRIDDVEFAFEVKSIFD